MYTTTILCDPADSYYHPKFWALNSPPIWGWHLYLKSEAPIYNPGRVGFKNENYGSLELAA